MSRLILLLFALLFWAAPASAEITCGDAEYSCVETDTASTGGIRLTSYCSREAGTRSCRDSAPLDECTATRASVNCTRTNRRCVDYRNGECRQWRLTYS
ncbi:conjugal transfer protein TraN, partial [Leisingera daeponensis]|uniref:conjugal transfer protein TraN n=1 Tax=Leisingera daeponensis TaxID=405746 RepID=UPI001C96DEC1